MDQFKIENFKENINYVIEASAGTGKTYNIIEIVKKLLQGKNIKLNDILIVTYTEKAAGELRDRIRKELPEEDVDNVPIFTIHSFCQSVIKEFGISSNLPLNLSLVGNDELNEFADKFIRDCSLIDDIAECLKQGIEINIDTLKNKLVDGVDKYYLDSNYNEDSEIIVIKDSNEFLDEINKLKNKKANKSNNDKIKKSMIHFLSCKYLKQLYIAWQKEKELNKKESYNDMIRSVREAILDNKCLLKSKLQEKYKYAIIDEFQDTNQLQFDIFSNIFLCENHNIIVVGDPKQSIYSFQGADVNVYYKAVDEILKKGGLKCSLNTNYRSTQNIVTSCNQLFKHFDFDGMDQFEESICPTDEVHKREVLFDGKDIESFWIGNKDLNDIEYAKAVVKEIIICCEKDKNGKTRLQLKKGPEEFRNVSFKDFAILGRTRLEMQAICNIFKKVGIPFVKYKDLKLFNGKECADWKDIFEAIDCIDFTGSNRAIFKKALFTNFFGLSLQEIADEKYNTDESDQMVLISKWKLIASEKQWEDLIDDILVSSNIIDRMSSLTNIDSIGIYKQIGNYCVDYLTSNHSINDLINKLNDLSQGEEDTEDGNVVERSTNFDAIQLLTMHTSKGLQFPVVIAVGGFKQFPPEKGIVTYHKENKKILDFQINEEFKKERLEETKRLFYVAYTRAEYILMFPCVSKFITNNDKNFIIDSINQYENNNKFKRIDASIFNYKELKEKVQNILNKPAEESKEERVKQEEVLKTIIKESNSKKVYKHSYSSLSHSGVIDEDDNKEGVVIGGLSNFDTKVVSDNPYLNESNNAIQMPSDYPKGSNIGTCLHEILEKIDFTNTNNLIYIVKNSFSKNGFKDNDEKWNDYTKKIIDNVLNAKLPIIKGNNITNDYLLLSEIPNNCKKNEVEFSYNLLNEKLKNYCNGFIDLLFKNGEYYSIVDWKSDGLSDDFISFSSQKDLQEHVSDCYSIQRVIYSYSLIQWLKCYYKNETEEELFNNHFGGIYYIFVRGCNEGTGNGVYCQTWNNYKELENSFNEIINSRIWR